MKNLFLTICSTLMIACTAIFGCQDQNEVSSINKLDRGEEIAKIYGGEIFSGKVTFSQDTEGSLVGTFTTTSSTKIFTLQKGDKISSSNPKEGNYEILYLKHVLVLNSLTDKKKYLLTVSNELSQKITKELPSSYLKGINVLDGYGLSVTTVPLSNANGRIAEACASSGGAGAVSCANSCCSVSCSTNYYASCGTSCRCNHNPVP